MSKEKFIENINSIKHYIEEEIDTANYLIKDAHLFVEDSDNVGGCWDTKEAEAILEYQERQRKILVMLNASLQRLLESEMHMKLYFKEKQ